MPLAITQDHRELADVVRTFAAGQGLREQTRRLLEQPPQAADSGVLWQQVQDLGWAGLHLPEEHGGSGYGLAELAVVLEGLGRFRVVRELTVDTPYRQVEADRSAFAGDEDEADPLGIAHRAELEQESRLYADALGYSVDWEAVTRLDDEMLVNGIAQIAPFDPVSKQALLEAPDIAARCELLVQFMQFQRMIPGGADGPETLQ